MADELDDQAAMAQWASENPPGGGEGVNEFGDFSGGMGGWDDGGGDGASERILNQDEIDSLLGFDLSGTAPTTARASAPSSTRRSSRTSACRCWKSSSTAWCG